MKATRPRADEPIRLVFTKSGHPRYRVVLDAGTHPNGKRRQIRSTHDTLTAARDHVSAHRADRLRGLLLAPDRQTFEVYAQRWIERRSREVRAVTVAAYRAVLAHGIREFGSKPLMRVDRRDVETVVATLYDRGRSKRTSAFTLFVLRAIFEDAVDEKLIGANPARRVKAVGHDSVSRQALTSNEVRELREHLVGDPLYACWLLTLYGLRRSEVMGLRWSDIDLSTGTLVIARGRVLVDGRRTVEGAPKTRRGARRLSLPGDVLAALRDLRKTQLAAFGAEQARAGYLAVDAAGQAMRPERWTDLWRKHCEAAGITPVTLHGARHSSVTAMRESGVPDHLVAAWHGHDENVMRAVYSHANADGIKAAGLALSEAFGAPSGAGM